MKRWTAFVLAVLLAVGSSGCISVHKTETHEAKHRTTKLAAEDCH